MAKHVVKAPMIVVYEDGAQRYLKRGAEVPDTVDKDHVRQLLNAGLIEKAITIPAQAERVAVTDPAKMSVPQLRAYASEKNIALGDATKATELRAVIAAAEAKAPGSEAPSAADIAAADQATDQAPDLDSE